MIPDPEPSPNQPTGPVTDPSSPDKPAEYNASSNGSGKQAEEDRLAGLDAYDEAVDESFPASDPPAASEPGR
ncbi:MAG: hypothetical protein QOJ39_1282 [Candidatus Eremiobacteraeota bacterium]|nr:hypothetical protein [Candidatus Eremiobacteraeota bacterium]MEA2719418.1 hypothetical protein [Candidatus Eremiobacteraeota bacterium]